ncbi:MAG TPA: DUF6122 family protein [Lysobacter sp.]|nr:DUF6122 family protein [Lysobacter sp.]
MDLPDLRASLHLLLHALVPLAVALAWPGRRWAKTCALLLAGWLIDVDHLLADPIYAPGRCSIGFHPLHEPWAIAVYVAMLAPTRTRVLAVGLLIHVALDGIDCMLMR